MDRIAARQSYRALDDLVMIDREAPNEMANESAARRLKASWPIVNVTSPICNAGWLKRGSSSALSSYWWHTSLKVE